jgi:predicted nucleotide-binding protein (sugar kinase/HSP70/actin superfamily)
MDKTSCPIVAGAPNVMKAAFTKEIDFFARAGIEYLDPPLTFAEMNLTSAPHVRDVWGPRLGITEDESRWAVDQGMRALDAFENDARRRGREVLETVERENKVAILRSSAAAVPLTTRA